MNTKCPDCGYGYFSKYKCPKCEAKKALAKLRDIKYPDFPQERNWGGKWLKEEKVR
jgi:hypothetical protein